MDRVKNTAHVRRARFSVPAAFTGNTNVILCLKPKPKLTKSQPKCRRFFCRGRGVKRSHPTRFPFSSSPQQRVFSMGRRHVRKSPCSDTLTRADVAVVNGAPADMSQWAGVTYSFNQGRTIFGETVSSGGCQKLSQGSKFKSVKCFHRWCTCGRNLGDLVSAVRLHCSHWIPIWGGGRHCQNGENQDISGRRETKETETWVKKVKTAQKNQLCSSNAVEKCRHPIKTMLKELVSISGGWSCLSLSGCLMSPL